MTTYIYIYIDGSVIYLRDVRRRRILNKSVSAAMEIRAGRIGGNGRTARWPTDFKNRDHPLPRRLPVSSKAVLGMTQMTFGQDLGYDEPGLWGDLRPGEHR